MKDSPRLREPEAFEALYRAHHRRVFATALRMMRDVRAAEEVVQDAFVRAWWSLGSFEGTSAFSTWLHRITVHAACDRIRADRRWADLVADDDTLTQYAADALRAMPDAAVDLERAIAALPNGARVVLLLHDVEGYRYDEIAQQLGVALGTVKSQLNRARRLVAEALER
ncbi:MAG TPA: sigma-70 family RNA polymerase sigma factor [Gemmatimonadaceae bacterium]|nr:sigma-70 family RNA polymerase sigma factor [Gemmatimonadaceae bacterium]